MKIAWRYESLSRGGEPPHSSMGEQHITDAKSLSVPFCHTFDLTTKLESRDCKGDLDMQMMLGQQILRDETKKSNPFLKPSLFTSRSIRRAMDSPEANSGIEQIRISKIADRYLVFDADHTRDGQSRSKFCY
ncbi:hypothetical protein HYQ46_005603 [Verticillium longisporum]|nr:hypothetical protein HYQ46_005603 [Verticillium longisporum]